jgi:ppGpp synthetase/RelA/SpoT-type nucleotidyltranferase
MSDAQHAKPDFDLVAHRRRSVENYQKVRHLYEAFASVLRNILDQALRSAGIKIASIEARAKTLESFGDKATEPSEADPDEPRYNEPLKEITDLTGARIITFFPKTVERVDRAIVDEFDILERTDRGDQLEKEEKLGYKSVHYLVRLKASRLQLPEYSRFADLVAEIQVRTILQHAWAEIEHDIQYKSVETIPGAIRTRFMSLAGLLEIADREFQAIQNDDERIRQNARALVAQRRLDEVEITGDALKAYLDKRLGPDGRITDYMYEWTARMLRRYGFANFQQIDDCVAPYDDDTLSRAITGTRKGQLKRFEFLLMAGMGEKFFREHELGREQWWRDWREHQFEHLKSAKIPIGSYNPKAL